MEETCNTCGGTGRWETTLEDAPTVLIDLGVCPDCSLGHPNMNDHGHKYRHYGEGEVACEHCGHEPSQRPEQCPNRKDS